MSKIKELNIRIEDLEQAIYEMLRYPERSKEIAQEVLGSKAELEEDFLEEDDYIEELDLERDNYEY